MGGGVIGGRVLSGVGVGAGADVWLVVGVGVGVAAEVGLGVGVDSGDGVDVSVGNADTVDVNVGSGVMVGNVVGVGVGATVLLRGPKAAKGIAIKATTATRPMICQASMALRRVGFIYVVSPYRYLQLCR